MCQYRQTVFKTRREKFYTAMNDKGLEKAMVNRPTTLYYLTGIMITPYERFVGLALNAKLEQCIMVLPSMEKGIMARGDSPIPEITFLDSESPANAIKKALGPFKAIGLEMSYCTLAHGNQIASGSTELVDIMDIVQKLRSRKDAMEIETIRQAALCADQALTDALPMLKPGVSEKEFSIELLRLMSKNPSVNVESYIIQILGGLNSASPHGATSGYILQEGDAITVDFGAYYEHYWSDFCRTFFLGKAHPQLEKAYPIVLESHLEAMAAARPGICAKEIDNAARKVITDAGYGEYFIHRTGHGIGLDIHEDPYMHAENETILEEGMIFTVEPGIYLPGIGGIRIEDDVLITNDGWASLNTYPKDFPAMVI